MPNSIKEIGDGAFGGCRSLQMIDLSKTKISSIGKSMFAGCKTLTEVKLPDSIKVITRGAFSGCAKLGKINLPEGLCYIGHGAFDGTSALNTIEFPESLRYIGGGAFYSSGLKGTLKIPAGVTNLQGNAFGHCGGVSEVKIPDTVEQIHGSALDFKYDASNAKDQTFFIPPSVYYLTRDSLTPRFANQVEWPAHTIQGIKGSYASNATKIQNTWKFEEVAYNSKAVFDASGGKVDTTSEFWSAPYTKACRLDF